MSFLETTYYANTLKEWLIALVVLSVTLLALRLLKTILVSRLGHLAAKTKTDVDDVLIELIKQVRTFFLLAVGIYAASHAVKLPPKTADAVRVLLILSFLGQSAIWGTRLIQFWVDQFKERKLETDPAGATTVSALGFVGKLALWSVLLLLCLENLGVNVTGLVAGLGIGGIAIALAVQNILGDLFASLSIVLDKPFVIGDFIVVDSYLGVVKKVGLKTTRIQSLSGEQLVFSNSDLLSSRIRNYKKMYERRVVFTLGVTYQTSHAKLAAIPAMIKKMVEEHETARFDRAHFKEYGDFALVYEVVYYVKSPDYNIYMDIQQAINLAIYRSFAEEGIEFAYPTQTLFLQSEGTGSGRSGAEPAHEK